ncbi:MAG: hypothetical protein CFE21_14930 [Bacteroidetes bacterium B1(2017)]|nr:MAG: hypothetical protein CFE21_14930 [Bacteroidetes bacterium B1(2017)]
MPFLFDFLSIFIQHIHLLKYSSSYQPLTIAYADLLSYYLQEKGGYHFHFNGKEADNETFGDGNEYDYGLRIYSPRLGRFLSVDPLTKGFPELTPYQFSSNRPIDGIDLDGGEWKSQHSWNDVITDKSHIQQLGANYVKGMTYQDAWRATSPKIFENYIKKKIDCADLAIKGLVEFAYKYKLSVHFEDNKQGKDKDPTFDNDNYGFTKKDGSKVSFKEGQWERFADNIAANYGAADIFNNSKLATDKQWDDLEVGDLMSWKHPDNGGFHAQTITEIDRPTFGFDSYTTIQGNLDSGKSAPARKTEYTFVALNIRFGETIKGKAWNFKFFDSKK